MKAKANFLRFGYTGLHSLPRNILLGSTMSVSLTVYIKLLTINLMTLMHPNFDTKETQIQNFD